MTTSAGDEPNRGRDHTIVQESGQSVIHCIRAPVGGLFRHVRDLIEGQRRAAWRVGLICDGSTGGAFADAKLRALAPVCDLGIQRLDMRRYPAWSDINVVQRIAALCATRLPAVLHGHGAKGAAYARLVADRCGAWAVCTPHGGWLHYAPRSATGMTFAAIERALKSRTGGMIFESAYSATLYARRVGTLACPQAVIHNGLEDTEFASRPAAERRYEFVFVGELRTLKGLDTLLDAIALLRDAATTSVLIAGAGPDATRFRDRAARLGLHGVTFSAPIYPATVAFAQAACVVVPSHAESLPYIVLEAAACGVPLVATRVGGIPEIFGPFRDRLVAPGDARQLAAAMQAVRSDPERARVDAERLREQVRARFRVEDMVANTLAFYARVRETATA